jgi:hypothetical protein
MSGDWNVDRGVCETCLLSVLQWHVPLPSNSRGAFLPVCKLDEGRLNPVVFRPCFKLMNEPGMKKCARYIST